MGGRAGNGAATSNVDQAADQLLPMWRSLAFDDKDTPMTDDLRTRIAAALIECSPVMKAHDRGWVYGRADELADAVISELGLKKECTVWLDKPQHRFTTDWIEGGWDHRNL